METTFTKRNSHGANIKRWREWRGIKQEVLADKIGVSQATLSGYEKKDELEPEVLENKSRKTKRDGCEKRNAFIETKTKCASNLIRKVTAYLQNQSKTPSLYIKINGIQMDF